MIEHIQQVERHLEEVFSKQKVDAAVEAMAVNINADLADKHPVVLCTVIGGIIPSGLLLPRLNFPLELDYIHATRYRGETSGGHLHWLKQPEISLKDRTVLIIDDILDEGLTLDAIVDFCKAEGAKQTLTAVLIDKAIAQPTGLKQADYTGLVAPDKFLVGCGMDYKGYFRNLDYIAAIPPDQTR